MPVKRIAASRTFPVADVAPASDPLPEAPYHLALDRLLRPHTADHQRHPLLKASPPAIPRMLDGIRYHPFVAALHLAYAGHRPLVLSPDMIWLLICQGVAQHVYANAELLRPRIVPHPGRLTLEVTRGVPREKPTTLRAGDLQAVIHAFSDQVRKSIGPYYRLLAPDFSTTDTAQRAAFKVVLLGSMRRYFNYLQVDHICGIPSITLEGTPQDWRRLQSMAAGFADLGLEWWLVYLEPALNQFALASAGMIDRAYWQQIYRAVQPGEPCSTDSGTGWMAVFFPYIHDLETDQSIRSPWLAREFSVRDQFEVESTGPDPVSPKSLSAWQLREEQLPGGVTEALFTWEERTPTGTLLSRSEMEFLAGFVGVTQDRSNMALRPQIGWGVRGAAD